MQKNAEAGGEDELLKASEETKRVARLLEPSKEQDEKDPTSDEKKLQADSSSDDESAKKTPEGQSLEEPPLNEEQDTASLAGEATPDTPPQTKVEPQAPTVSVEAVEVDGDKVFIAGEAKAGGLVRVYIDSKSVGDVRVDENGRWLYEDKKKLPSGEHKIRVDQITTATGNVSARAEVPFVVEDRTLTELAEAENNTVIIRRNDNLWTIAQRLYGDGERFTAIYEQNRDQIRDPNLIFPGQTFTLPKVSSEDVSQN